jgi:hypothetical protein
MRLRSILAVFVAASLFFTACGDDGGDLESEAQDDSSASASEPADEGDDASEPSDEGDDASEPSDDSIPDLGDLDSIPDLGDLDDSIPDLGNLGDCLEFSLAYAGLFLTGLGVFGDEEAVQEAEDQLAELESSVPEELEEEFSIVSEAYGEYFSELADSSLSEMGEIEDPMSDSEVAEADATIQEWLEENCS